MPYLANADLPDTIKRTLPPHAQDIYRTAFNNAWQEYANRARHEEIAYRVAWAAVKKKYEKADGRWVSKD